MSAVSTPAEGLDLGAAGRVEATMEGEGRCQDCGMTNPVWHARNAVWNLVMGGPDATDDPGGFVCPVCFIVRAGKVGVGRVWALDVDDAGPDAALMDAWKERDSARRERDEARAEVERAWDRAFDAGNAYGYERACWEDGSLNPGPPPTLPPKPYRAQGIEGRDG